MEIKGAAVKTLPKFIQLKLPDIYYRWLDNLDPEVRKVFNSSVLVSRWYDIDKFIRHPTKVAAELAYFDVNELAWQMGAFSSEFALNSIYKFFLKFGKAPALIRQIPFFIQTYFRPPASVKIQTVDMEKKHAELELFNFVPYNDIVMYRTMGWGYNTLIIAGASDVKIYTKPVSNTDSLMVIDWKE